MRTLSKASTAAAVAVAGAGITLGGMGLAAAADEANGADTSDSTSLRAGGPGHGHGRGGPAGPDGAAGDLAAALDLSEDDVAAALETVRDELRPDRGAGETPTPPTEAQREQRRAEVAAALAEELGISEQRVTEALDSLGSERRAEARSELAERLAAAVDDGTLTDTDKESVLKAFDGGVLGGGHGGPR